MFSSFSADLRRYPGAEKLTEPSLWAIAAYRFGQWIAVEPRRRPLLPVYFGLHLVVSLLTGISIPKRAEIGPGLRIYHFGGVVVHPDVVAGRHLTIGHGVTLGVREDGRAPIVGDHVVLSAYAQVLGGVRIGDGAKVGAMSVVLADVPAGVSVAGIPARIVGQPRDVAD